MDAKQDERAWIFVSHASSDLKNVREVRNYLESKDAAPLLFHLKALTDPDEFWHLIEREIQERNFFLFCESSAAEESVWVQKERAAVEASRKDGPKRIGRIRVDSIEIDQKTLDEFLSKTRVFASFSHRDRTAVTPFLKSLESAGFSVFDALTEIKVGDNWLEKIKSELDLAAANGWVVAFLSWSSIQSQFVQKEIEHAMQLGAKFVPVLLENVVLPPNLMAIQAFDAFSNPVTAPEELAKLLIRR
jgi:hypothetical protein